MKLIYLTRINYLFGKTAVIYRGKDSHLYYNLILQRKNNNLTYLAHLSRHKTILTVTYVCIEYCSRFLTKSAFMTRERSLLGLSIVRAVSVSPGHKVITAMPVFS